MATLATAQDALVLRQFLTWLKADLKLTLLQHRPTPTLQDLMDFLLRKRALQHLSERVAMETPSTPKEVSLSRTVADLRTSVANLVEDQSLLRESISAMSAQSSPARVERRCCNCNAKAHTCVSCPWPTMCSNCMTWDHLQNDCPRTLLHRGESYPNSFHSFRRGPVPLRSAPVNVENEECPHHFAFANMNVCGAPLSSFSQQPLVLCKVNGVLVRALIDTGSMTSFISSRVYAELRPRPPVDVFTGNSCAPLTPYTSLTKDCPTYLFPVVERGSSTVLLTQSPSRGPVPVTLTTNVLILSRIEIILPCSVPQGVLGLAGMITPKPSANLSPSLQVAYTICNAGQGGTGIAVRIMNASNTDIEMFAGQKIADFCPMIESLQCPFPGVNYVASTAAHPSVQDELSAALSKSLPVIDRRILLDTLMQYTDVLKTRFR